jgi:hypothetical protein
LIATPEINWFPRNVIDATPCKAERAREEAMPAAIPIQTDPVIAATAAEKNAAHNILPSRPIKNTGSFGKKSSKAS